MGASLSGGLSCLAFGAGFDERPLAWLRAAGEESSLSIERERGRFLEGWP